MANSVDPDQTAPLGYIGAVYTVFAQACLSENLGTLQYCKSLYFCVAFILRFYDRRLIGGH